jgi:hypothetical protein
MDSPAFAGGDVKLLDLCALEVMFYYENDMMDDV